MDDSLVTRVTSHPQYQELKAKRTSLGWWLSLAGMLAHYGFILLVAFNKPLLAHPDLAALVRAYWWVLVLLVAGVWYGFKRYTSSPDGRAKYDRWKLGVPLVGDVATKIQVSSVARTLGTMVKSGVPLLQSLEIVKNVVSNTVLAKAIDDARSSIREEQSIAPPLKKSGLFPSMLLHMIAVGEKSGELEQMLAKAAEAYDREVESSVSAVTNILEPVMIIMGGGVVLFIVMAILLPIFEMNQLVR